MDKLNNKKLNTDNAGIPSILLIHNCLSSKYVVFPESAFKNILGLSIIKNKSNNKRTNTFVKTLTKSRCCSKLKRSLKSFWCARYPLFSNYNKHMFWHTTIAKIWNPSIVFEDKLWLYTKIRKKEMYEIQQ